MHTPRLTLGLVHEAQARICGIVNRTALLTSKTLASHAGAELFFKCENFQKTGVFKARGAANAVLGLSGMEAAQGVVTHSSGNHGAAVAWAAGLRRIPAYIVMPRDAPRFKMQAVERYGGKVILCDRSAEVREQRAEEVRVETRAELVHPYDDLKVMAGQGTTGLELLEDLPDLDTVICPVGGGGQLSGVAVAIKSLKPHVRVIGAEPAAADDAARSLRAGKRVFYDGTPTIADGLRTSLGELTFAEISTYVDDIVTVPEEDIVTAMRTIWEVLKIIIEPSAAVAYAAVCVHAHLLAKSRCCAVIFSGGNLDLERLPWQNAPAGEPRK